MLFGKLITTDLCRCCNSIFGNQCDYALAEDLRIVNAAGRVGISIADLWSRFEGIQQTPDGRQVRTVFKDGVFKPQSELSSLEKLAISATEGKICSTDLKNLRARLITKVRSKALGLSGEQISTEVDKLLADLETTPEKTHYNAVIHEGFRASPLKSKVIVPRETRPWETDWSLAKIVFELSNAVVGNPYRSYFSEVVGTVKQFLERRECSSDGKQGSGIFRYSQLPETQASKCHRIEAVLTPHRLEWHLTFFGTARWSYSMDVRPIRSPTYSQRVLIENPTETGDASVCIQANPKR